MRTDPPIDIFSRNYDRGEAQPMHTTGQLLLLIFAAAIWLVGGFASFAWRGQAPDWLRSSFFPSRW